MQFQPALGQRIAKVLFQLTPPFGIAARIGSLEVMPSSAAILRGVKRQIGIADQVVGGQPVFGRESNPDRGPDDNPVAVNRIGFGQGIDNPACQHSKILAAAPTEEHELELVAAQTPDSAIFPSRAFKAPGNLGQQIVARKMAHGIVDLLKPVQIEQKDRTGAVFEVGGAGSPARWRCASGLSSASLTGWADMGSACTRSL